MMTIAGLVVLASASLATPFMTFQAPPAAPAQGAGSDAAPAAAQTAVVPSEWPQVATTDGVTFTINEPSYTAIAGNTVTLRAVVQVKRATGSPTAGTLDMTAVVTSSETPGVVELNEFTINTCMLDDGTGAATQAEFAKLLEGVGFDATLSTIVEGIAIDSSRDVKDLSNAVPVIKVTERNTVLISVNGAPRFGPCGTGGWKRVVNTPNILLKSPSGAWYTRLSSQEWVSAATMEGPFNAAQTDPPQDVITALGKPKAPPADVKDTIDLHRTTHVQGPPPDVYIAIRPTVLVSISGKPELADACPGVQRVTNTADTILRSGNEWWILGSGRWFASTDLLKGPWAYQAADKVPAAFAKLPASGRMGAVRASVPGTTEAKAASLTSNLVRTLTLTRADAKCMPVYSGQPHFSPIEGSALSYCTNARQPVLKLDAAYYCCDDGAWFTATDPNGPWTLCDSVPEAIYSIPASCPVYACTYVEVYGSTPNAVTYGSTAGYFGTYMQNGTPVYGTGYDYNAALHASTADQDAMAANDPNYVAPAYPATYGNQAEYSPDDGTYAPPTSNEYIDDYPDMYSDVYDDGYGGYGWCPYWGSAYGYGYGYGYGWNDWGRWHRRWDDHRRTAAAARAANDHRNDLGGMGRANANAAAADRARAGAGWRGGAGMDAGMRGAGGMGIDQGMRGTGGMGIDQGMRGVGGMGIDQGMRGTEGVDRGMGTNRGMGTQPGMGTNRGMGTQPGMGNNRWGAANAANNRGGGGYGGYRGASGFHSAQRMSAPNYGNRGGGGMRGGGGGGRR